MNKIYSYYIICKIIYNRIQFIFSYIIQNTILKSWIISYYCRYNKKMYLILDFKKLTLNNTETSRFEETYTRFEAMLHSKMRLYYSAIIQSYNRKNMDKLAEKTRKELQKKKELNKLLGE